MFGSNRKTWRNECKRLLEQNNMMSDRLHEFQVQIEVSAEALQRKDDEMMAFIHKLHNTMGGDTVPTCEEEALAALRVIRGRADKYLAIREVLAGNFDPDEAILRRIACAVGTSQLDLDSVVNRAGQLSSVHVKNAEMYREMVKLEQKVQDLEEQLDS